MVGVTGVVNQTRQAVFLVGGRGTRLGGLTDELPKPVIDIGGKPFLEYVLRNTTRFGFSKVLFLCGYRADRIIDRFGDGRTFGTSIDYCVEEEPAGTAGALLKAAQHLEDEFLLVNGDTFFDFNYLDLAVRTPPDPWLVRMALRRVPDSRRYGHTELDGPRVAGFSEKGGQGEALVNGGVYWVNKDIVDCISRTPCSLEKEILPLLTERSLLWAWKYDGFFIDIGIPEEVERAREVLPAHFQRPAAFLDRDGVLDVDNGYVHRPEHFTWTDGAKEAVKLLNDRGYMVFVVTNQAGVARGYYPESDVVGLHNWMNGELNKIGAHIDAFYYCPHHPNGALEEYRCRCACRKPAPGMLNRALSEWNFDKERSFMIGDRASDMEAAVAFSVKGYLFDEGNMTAFVRRILQRLQEA